MGVRKTQDMGYVRWEADWRLLKRREGEAVNSGRIQAQGKAMNEQQEITESERQNLDWDKSKLGAKATEFSVWYGWEQWEFARAQWWEYWESLDYFLPIAFL